MKPDEAVAQLFRAVNHFRSDDGSVAEDLVDDVIEAIGAHDATMLAVALAGAFADAFNITDADLLDFIEVVNPPDP